MGLLWPKCRTQHWALWNLIQLPSTHGSSLCRSLWYSLPKHIFTSVLRPWVVLQKPICLSAVINNSPVLPWFSTLRALPREAAVPGSQYWHWKQNTQMPISQLSERWWVKADKLSCLSLNTPMWGLFPTQVYCHQAIHLTLAEHL